MGVCSGKPRVVGALLFALVAAGCAKSQRDGEHHGQGGTGGDGGSRGGSAGSGPASGGTGVGPGGQGGAGDEACVGLPLVERRLVRLTSHQIVSSIGALLGDDVAGEAARNENLPPITHRAFPPFDAEGIVTQFSSGDRIASAVAKHVRDDFASVTGCGGAPTDACARDFLKSFAERAFRRPVTRDESDNILVVYDESKAFGGTIQEAVQHGVWAILDSPLFLYRTEYGEHDVTRDEVRLSSYELASALSYFLTDAPPDAELLDAARRDELGTPDGIAAHAERLLATPAARANLEAAMLSYFRIPIVESVVIDPAIVPDVTVNAALLASMYREGELFFRQHLWNGDLENLLTTRTTMVNAELATSIYGVTPPTAVDADGFGAVELPGERAGALTMSAFLTSRSRPDGPSVIARGMAVNLSLLCASTPVFDPVPEPDPAPSMQGWSAREKAEFRMTDEACRECHIPIDPFGLALDVFDVIGRYRTTDSAERPIDPAVTLPEILEGQAVSGPAEMAAVVARSERFKACMIMNFMSFALADVSQGGPQAPSPAEPTDGCEVRNTTRAFLERSDRSFSAMVTEIARAPLFSVRRRVP